MPIAFASARTLASLVHAGPIQRKGQSHTLESNDRVKRQKLWGM
jgi:hypothetical protein